jgi:hypothetical protein
MEDEFYRTFELKEEELKAREQRKLDPRRQDLVRRIVEGHPETKWDSEALQRLHDDLDVWGE